MRPIQQAVTDAVSLGVGDHWRAAIPDRGIHDCTKSLYWSLVRNEVAHDAALADKIRMEMCTEYGRIWQEGAE